MGIALRSGSAIHVVNNIITACNESFHNYGGSLTGSNNLFYNNVSNPNLLTNWIIDDPNFVNAATDNYHINEDSPAVNAGTWVALSEDFDGESRSSGGGYDIGADEVQSGVLVFIPLLIR